ncbi:hypothetical protein [Thermococcus thermotolerans]|uniref:hypothetical protein n=1 Tax=Thermococcus thermotolerans TaxID=2969672 RepID=UPI002157A248|nr:hypothetical protein [Thermococcus thermotolerans]
MEDLTIKRLMGELDIRTIRELLEAEEVRREIRELSKTVRRGMFGEGGTNEEFRILRAEVNEQ